MHELSGLPAHELINLIATKEVSAVEVTQHALNRAEETQSTLNAFFHLMPREAMEAAKRAERAVLQGERRWRQALCLRTDPKVSAHPGNDPSRFLTHARL